MPHTGLIQNLREKVRYRRGLRVAATRYFEHRFCSEELTFEADRKLKKLEGRAIPLALATFAYDVRCTAAEIIELHMSGNDDEALDVKVKLTIRTLNNWAMHHAGFSSPVNICELADLLGIGLGKELQSWLLTREIRSGEVVSWLQKFGPEVEQFCEYVRR